MYRKDFGAWLRHIGRSAEDSRGVTTVDRRGCSWWRISIAWRSEIGIPNSNGLQSIGWIDSLNCAGEESQWEAGVC